MTCQARHAGQFIMDFPCQSTAHMVLYALSSFSISLVDNLCSMPKIYLLLMSPGGNVSWWESRNFYVRCPSCDKIRRHIRRENYDSLECTLPSGAALAARLQIFEPFIPCKICSALTGMMLGSNLSLATNKPKLQIVAEEARSAFYAEEDITLKGVTNLKYFAACYL
jgi:hypothetical protein